MDDPLPPFFYPAQNQRERRWHARLKKEGRIRSIGPRLHTSLPDAAVAGALRGSWSRVVSTLYPGALVSHRTALEYVPSPEGVIFLTAATRRTVIYPGLTLEFVVGPPPLDDDRPFLVTLRASSRSRAFLENLSIDPRRKHTRSISSEAIEERLEKILHVEGEFALNQLRDRSREIAVAFGWHAPLKRLEAIIGALLGTRSADHVTGAPAKARAAGMPFDPACLERLNLLCGELRTRAVPTLRETVESAAHLRNKAFFEAYFSNYIEGTTFEIDEAERIVFDHRIPDARPVDAHDIVGTFELVADPNEMRRVPERAIDLTNLLQQRHGRMLSRRPEVMPGHFKTAANKAGSTRFVAPDYVRGTLEEGFALYRELPEGMARAIFLMFLVSDVHPFNDGNGRIARVMMNAELVSAGASTIIIPTSYRDDYIGALKALTQRHRPGVIIEALTKAAMMSRLDFTVYPEILAELRRRHWFEEPDEGTPIVSAIQRLTRQPE